MPSKIYRSVVLAALITLSATVAVADPQITVVEGIKDFGTVPKGEVLTHAFQIRNTGDSDLEILRVQPACGCTVAEFDSVIRPGETGKVMAEVKTEAFNGPINKTVTILSNDPNTPSSIVTMKAVVKPYVEAYPAGFLRYNLLHGDADKKSVVLFSEEREPFKIERVETPGDWVKVEWQPAAEAERAPAGPKGQNQYRVTVTLGGPDAPVGPLVDKVFIHTNSKHQPVYPLSLSGMIRPGYNVMPTVLNFGRVAPESMHSTKVLTVSTNNRLTPGSFEVMKVETDIPEIVAADVRPSDREGVYEVEVKLRDKVAEGDLQGELKIYTSDAGTPVFTVPVRGTVTR